MHAAAPAIRIPRGVTANFDPSTGKLTITVPQRGPMVRAKDRVFYAIARALFSVAFGAATPFPPARPFDRVREFVGRIGTWFASFSDDAEVKILNHVFGDGTYAAITAHVALCTVVPTDASTGATITEANYTGYARLAIAASDMSAAAAGSKTNSAALTFAACTAGASTIIGFAILDSITIGAGNAIMWGTVTSKVIDTANTPPTIAIGALVATLD